ncbi:Bud-site selection protein [Mycena sanguinolenta]|nr:Bud-site selection protein [Mycena sanguinolenta]
MHASTSSTTTTQQRGTKRKRPDSAVEDPTNKLAGKLHHDLKEVRKAAKKARTFETQRVVKKLKGLRKKTPTATSEISVLEAELEELKTLDSDAIASTALRTRLLKDRHINESVPAQAAIARELPLSSAPTPIPNSKVYARLLSARALGAAVAQTVAAMRAVLLPPPDADADAEAGAGAGADEVGDEDEDEEDAGEEGEDDEEGADVDAAGWESGSVDGGDSDEEQDGEEDDTDGWESGSVHSDAPPPPPKKTKAASVSASATKAQTKAAPANAKVASQGKTTTSASQFLPSLAVGYVRGGSDDSDVEDADAGGGERKNRRGQRARQAIWEKKYGRGANHKKKEAAAAAAERAEQKAKWEARQAKREAAAAGRVQDGGWAGRNAKTGTGVGGPAGAAKEKGLHPSWAAKKALKEKMAMGGGVVPQGKKIVFE